MSVAKYKLIYRNGIGGTVPDYIQNGGLWYDPDDSTLIGWCQNIRNEYFVIGESDAVELTKSQIVERFLSIHHRYPTDAKFTFQEETSRILTDAEVTQIAETWFDSYCEEMSEAVNDPIEVLKSRKIASAFKHMERRLEDAFVNVYISSANQDCPFGCDKITQENIIGINTAIARGVTIPDPTMWTPKQAITPVSVTHVELAEIGGSILMQKNQHYGVYFTHKTGISNLTDKLDILKYDFALGY